jgi:hypothetical protein
VILRSDPLLHLSIRFGQAAHRPGSTQTRQLTCRQISLRPGAAEVAFILSA